MATGTGSDPSASEALERLRAIGADLPEITERVSHGAPTLFIRGKRVLAHLFDDHHGSGDRTVWCPAPPGVQAELVEQEPDRFFVPPYVGHKGWIGVRVDVDPDWDEMAGLLEEAYRLVAPKTLVKRLDEERADSLVGPLDSLRSRTGRRCRPCPARGRTIRRAAPPRDRPGW